MIGQAPALWIFDEDIKNRSWLEWLRAHISFGKPLHRYDGIATLHATFLSLDGFDNREKVEVAFRIDKYKMEQLYHGFDDVFSLSESRGLGLTWHPLRLTYTSENLKKNIYLIINYRYGKTDNLEFFELLKDWVS